MSATNHAALWVSHFPVFGGPHNLALQLARPLARRGWRNVVVLPDEPGSAAKRLRAGGIEVVQVPLHRLRATADPREHVRTSVAFRSDIRRIRALISDRSIDAVVLTGLTNPHAAIAARGAGAAIIWQILDSRNPAPLRHVGMRFVRHYADVVMFDGHALERLHVGGRPLSVPTFQFTPVVDLDRFHPDPAHRALSRRKLDVPKEVLFVGTVANVNPMKGIEYFVRASNRIFRKRPDAYFLISGATYETHRAYLERIREEIQRSDVPEDRWRLSDDPPDDHYPALDVKLITSVPRSEGTTTTALEAFACGIPVVATDVGAVGEVVEDGVTGLVVPPLDADALAAATLRLAADPDLRRRMGEAGRQRAVERYGLNVGADVHARALDTAIAGRALLRH